jgi:rare lipoprotein A
MKSKDTLKKNKLQLFHLESKDSVCKEGQLKFIKKNAHASYYADKFHGKQKLKVGVFDKSKYTAAHKKLPFNQSKELPMRRMENYSS